MSSIAVASETPPQTRALSHVDLTLVALTFGTLWVVLCRHLSGEWAVNEQYSYGWFVPIFAAYLFWLRWNDRPEPKARREKTEGGKQIPVLLFTLAFLLLFLLLPLRVFEIGNPDWRPLGWIHAAIVVGLSLLYLGAIGRGVWVRHFAFPVCFIFVAVPWVSAVEAPLVGGLMRIIATAAAETLALFGVPAQVQGNLIRLPSGFVAINEACSGVRSLQTSLMIGLLFGELKRLSILRRLSLVAGAIAIALMANFLRALFLVAVAARDGLSATAHWHDFAGYGIVVLVFVGTLLFANKLARTKAETRTAEIEDRSFPKSEVRNSKSAFSPSSFLLFTFAWLLLTEVSAHGWYRAHEGDLQPQPQWTVAWPESAPGFREVKIDAHVRQTLLFDSGREALWPLPQPNDFGIRSTCYAFFFRWNPGSSGAVRARAHRPDICLPSAGWQQTADRRTRSYDVDPALSVPFRHLEFSARASPNERALIAHTFYCLHQDFVSEDKPLGEFSGAPTLGQRLAIVRHGIRGRGQQVLEVVLLTPEVLPGEQVEAAFAQIVRNIITH